MLDLTNMNTEDKKKFIIHTLSIEFYKLKEKIKDMVSIDIEGDDITIRIIENREPTTIKIEHPKIKNKYRRDVKKDKQ